VSARSERREKDKTYDVVQVCGYAVEGHVNVISAYVQVLVVEGLMDVADKLRRR
jgi:hypothetical protein